MDVLVCEPGVPLLIVRYFDADRMASNCRDRYDRVGFLGSHDAGQNMPGKSMAAQLSPADLGGCKDIVRRV